MVAGVPGKIIRELSAEEREGLKENARHYLELASAHRGATEV
jgi:carbonic anhydrase/acetyltransferase-like protein (isoleucine patch superfamily)